MKKIILLLSVLFLTNGIYAQDCEFDKNGFREVPWGHIQNTINYGKVSEIRGRLFDVADDVIPEAGIAVYQILKNKKKFIGSQITDKKGNFCFRNVKRGTYEINIGKDGFNSMVYIVKLYPDSKNYKNFIKAYLDVGT